MLELDAMITVMMTLTANRLLVERQLEAGEPTDTATYLVHALT